MFKLKARNFGTLSVITALLVFSAGFRILGSSGLAFALEGEDPTEVASVPDTSTGAKDENLNQLLASFQAREKAIAEVENWQNERSEQLERAEAAIAAAIEKLETTEVRLRNLLAIADDAAEDDVAKLTNVYENMKPKAAATVFEQMPAAFAAGFLSRMRPESAAPVMASITPQSAYAISVVLAGRNAEAPTNKVEAD